MKTISDHNTFLCCDFNCTLTALDRYNARIDKTGIHLKNLITSLNLDDIFRRKNPNMKNYTYHNRNFTSQSRIDYIFTTKYHLGNISVVLFKQVPKVP